MAEWRKAEEFSDENSSGAENSSSEEFSGREATHG